MSTTTTKTEFEKRYNALRAEAYNGWNSSWKELSTYINQKRGFFDDTANRGKMIDHQTLLDGYASQAVRTLASGLQSGMTSPSRPWFKLMIDEIALNVVPSVSAWLDEVEKVINEIFRRSNFYDCTYSAYEELGQFGTMSFAILPDFYTAIRCRNFTVGEYYLGSDSRGRINSFARGFWMTVEQLVNDFGYENCSPSTQSLFESNRVDTWIKVGNLIEPNRKRTPGMQDFKNMPFRSAYWELSGNADKLLDVRGFNSFPIIASRWDTTTTDQVYGYGPGWQALGDIKQLQKTTLDKLLAQEKLHNPPMLADSNIEGHVNLLPGGVTKTSLTTPNSGVRAAYQIDPKLESFIQLINELHGSIDRYFFRDLFMMLTNVDRDRMTATEVAERQQEKIMMMGPILYKIQSEMLDPAMELVFSIANELGLIPPAPEEIQGMNIKVRYVSILAQAQQSLGVEQINRVIGFVATTANMAPQVLDVINWDETVRQVGEMEGVPAKIINDIQTVNATREQKAAAENAQKMAQAAAIAESASKTTKNLATAPMDENSALDGLMKGVQQ